MSGTRLRISTRPASEVVLACESAGGGGAAHAGAATIASNSKGPMRRSLRSAAAIAAVRATGTMEATGALISRAIAHAFECQVFEIVAEIAIGVHLGQVHHAVAADIDPGLDIS